jgi:hypothetical protein
MLKLIIVKFLGIVFILFGSMVVTTVLIPVAIIALGFFVGTVFFNAGMNLVDRER